MNTQQEDFILEQAQERARETKEAQEQEEFNDYLKLNRLDLLNAFIDEAEFREYAKQCWRDEQ